MTIELRVNGRAERLEVAPETPLLWALRETLRLTGAKFGCGMGLCGACTVHVNGEATRSCVTPISQVSGKDVTTIEGLAGTGALHPLQQAWLDEQVPQCGYCQPGQIMGAAALLASNPAPSDAEIVSMMSGHLCRCGTYPRIQRAIRRVAKDRS
jgi:aerobic-type carbon monoxide dehydrogenase small subunit (CoxS/CutS family)